MLIEGNYEGKNRWGPIKVLVEVIIRNKQITHAANDKHTTLLGKELVKEGLERDTIWRM